MQQERAYLTVSPFLTKLNKYFMIYDMSVLMWLKNIYSVCKGTQKNGMLQYLKMMV